MAENTSIDVQLRQELDELVTSMCKALNTPQHLAVLRDRGLAATERQGNSVHYSLRHPRIIEAIDILRSVMSGELNRQHALRAPRLAPA